MKRLAFFDTNVLVYAEDEDNPTKQLKALDLVSKHYADGTLAVSLQVLQEYFSTLTRKRGMDLALAQRKVELLSGARVVRFGPEDVISAIELHRLSRISFWDSLIVHAARLVKADVLYTEDMQDGSVVGGVRIHNPFRSQ